MNIMFVCLGNICRSPLAHAVFQHLVNLKNLSSQFNLDSSGTSAYHIGEPADSRMIMTARNYGILIDHLVRQFKRPDFERYDLIMAMDRQNYSDIIRLSSNEKDHQKVKLFREYDPKLTLVKDVPDPYFGGENGFDNVFKIVSRTCENLLSVIMKDFK